MTDQKEERSANTANGRPTPDYETDRRKLLRTAGVGVVGITAGVIGITGPGHTSATGRVSADEDRTTIEDWHDLDAIRTDLDGEYVLVEDLDSDTPGYDEHVGDPDGGWEPIDEFDDSTLDGNGYNITGLVIDRPDEEYVGLFGQARGGRIQDLSIRDADITGGDRVGTFVGIGGCEVANSDATGSVSGDSRVGGIIGYSNQKIIDSHTEQEITASNGGVGGLVGTYESTVSDSYATGPVSGDGTAGGLVGSLFIDGTIIDSYATGSVDGNSRVGGLVGSDYFSSITDSYATGTVSGDTSVGGLVGRSQGDVPIEKSHATGAVSGENDVGGLVGTCEENNIVRESYATGTVSGDTSVGGLVGQAQFNSIVSDSYATGLVDGEGSVGGLIGSAQEIFVETGVTRSYATGPVDGTENVGGLVGRSGTDDVTDSYWDVPATGQDGSSGGGTGLGSLNDEPPAEEMTGQDATEFMDGFDFDDTWETTASYPILAWQDSGPSVTDYTNEDRRVTTDGLRDAVADWRAGDIDTGLLRDVVDAWRSGDPVA